MAVQSQVKVVEAARLTAVEAPVAEEVRPVKVAEAEDPMVEADRAVAGEIWDDSLGH